MVNGEWMKQFSLFTIDHLLFTCLCSSFILSLDASSARLLASNSGLFAEGQAGY
jgi:hypothetical protein